MPTPFASSSARAVLARGSRRAATGRLLASRRSVHTLPKLNYPVDNGLGNFLSPRALQTIAVDYQGGLLTRLNELVKDTDLQSTSVVDTVIQTAREPDQVLTFNTASQALNNSFFLDNLAPPPQPEGHHEAAISTTLVRNIEHQFGSLGQFKSNVSAAAMGMTTSGWIWFVMDSGRRFAIVPTYGAGTALVRSRQQMVPQSFAPSVDRIPNSGSGAASLSPTPGTVNTTSASFNANSSPLHQNPTASSPFDPQGQTRQYSLSAFAPTQPVSNQTTSPSSGALFEATTGNVAGSGNVGASWIPHDSQRSKHMGDKLTPIFCLSVHEHAWLYDYGVWGKEEYLKRFWDALDWGRVSELYHAVGGRL